MFGVGELVMVKGKVVFKVGESPKVMEGNDEEEVLGCLPIHLALDKRGQVVA